MFIGTSKVFIVKLLPGRIRKITQETENEPIKIRNIALACYPLAIHFSFAKAHFKMNTLCAFGSLHNQTKEFKPL